MIKNIIFDMGNVLVDFCWEEAFKSKGLQGEIFERVANATVRNEDWDEYDLANIPLDQIIQNFVDNDKEMEKEIRLATSSIGDMIKKKDYAKDLILDIKKAGYKVYVLSNMSPQAFEQAGDVLMVSKLADGEVYSCDYHLVKPDRRLYEILLNKYSLNAKECVFLDDKPENVEGAKVLGIKGIVFTNLDNALKELSDLGVNI